jgi:hypothetical protein
MPSPMTTVVVLTILWLIVVVPMIVRRPAGLPRRRSAATATRTATTIRTGTGKDRGSRMAANRRRASRDEEESVSSPDERDVPELSAARQHMMARRRRSLTILIVGVLASVPVALWRGGLTWLLVGAFAAGLAGYLYFLRAQARRDRDRQAVREGRAAARQFRRRPQPSPSAHVTATADSAVPIDDDDLSFQSMDTMDLTGLYDETTVVTSHRRAG